MKSCVLKNGAILALAVAAVAAQAQTALAPGGTVLTPVLPGFPDNYVSLDFSQTPFTGVNALGETRFTGNLQSYVFRNTVDNTLGFAWIVTNDATSTSSLEALGLTGYQGFSTSVAQDPVGLGGGTNSFAASRDALGDVVSFSWLNTPLGSGTIVPGTFSSPQWIFTNATSYTIGSANLIDGAVATVPTFAPKAVPEPASMAALGLGAIGILRRRKKA